MRKSLQMQADMSQEFGACVFDVTLDCEDGAPAGGEVDHATMVVDIVKQAYNASKNVAPGQAARVGVRLHPVDHSAFASDVEIIIGSVAGALQFVMIPKVESLQDVEMAVAAIDQASSRFGIRLPLHVLIESPTAVRQVFAIAAHPRVESLSFGLMDFVSSHGGAIPACAMSLRSPGDVVTVDQFHHPLVVRAKLEISSASHAFGKVPSHCVVTEFRDTVGLERAVRHAYQAFGFTRMWSIHPDQIRPILKGFAPSEGECDMATEVIMEAQRQEWAPIALRGTLHDRASYRYFWQVLERAHRTGVALPAQASALFALPVH